MIYLGVPAQFSYPPTTVGRVAESEWGPIHGGATQNWLEEYITKINELQIPELLSRRITPTTGTIPFLRLHQRDRNLTSPQRATTPSMILLPSACHVDLTLQLHCSGFLQQRSNARLRNAV